MDAKSAAPLRRSSLRVGRWFVHVHAFRARRVPSHRPGEWASKAWLQLDVFLGWRR